MKLDRLALRNFRNYERLESSFSPGVNLIVGDNAQGKTNLLEAVFYLSTGRSFRTRREMELIRFGSEFADLEGDVTGQARQQSLRALLFASRKPRQLFLNGVKKRSHGEMSGILTTVLFCPEDLLVLKAGAAAAAAFWTRLCANCGPDMRPPSQSTTGFWSKKAKFCGTGLKIHLFCKCCRNIPTACARLGPF